MIKLNIKYIWKITYLFFVLSNCIFLSIKAIKMYFKFILLSEKIFKLKKIKLKYPIINLIKINYGKLQPIDQKKQNSLTKNIPKSNFIFEV